VSCPLAVPEGQRKAGNAKPLGELAMRVYVPVKLQVHVVGGNHLPPADSNGLSDPYCKLFFEGRPLGERGGMTKVLSKTLHPVWQGECFEIVLPAPLAGITSKDITSKDQAKGLLKVEVWDKDGGFLRGGSDDLLGEVLLDLSTVESTREIGLTPDSNGNATAKLTLPLAGGAEGKRQAAAAKKAATVAEGTLTLRLAYTRSAIDPARVLGRALMNNWQTSGGTWVYFDIRIPNAPDATRAAAADASLNTTVLRLGVKVKPTMLVSDVCALLAKQLEPKYVQYAGRLCLFDKSTKEPLPPQQRIYPELHSGRDLALMINANNGEDSTVDGITLQPPTIPREHFERLAARLRQFYMEPSRAAECARQLPKVEEIVGMVNGNEAVLDELLRMKYGQDLSSVADDTAEEEEKEEKDSEDDDEAIKSTMGGNSNTPADIEARKVVAEMEVHTASARHHLEEQFAKDGGVSVPQKGKKAKKYLDIYVAASDVMVAGMAVEKKGGEKGKGGPSNVYAKMWIVDGKSKKIKKGGTKAKTRLQKAQAEEVVGWDDAKMDRLRLTCDSTDLSNGGMLRLKIKKKGGCCGGSKTIAEKDFPLASFGMIGGTAQAETDGPACMNLQLPQAAKAKKTKGEGKGVSNKPVTVGLVYTHPGPTAAGSRQ